MPKVVRTSAQCGRLRLLTSIGKEIAQHEEALVTLRQTRDKLIRQYERGKYLDEIESLRRRLANFEGDDVA